MASALNVLLELRWSQGGILVDAGNTIVELLTPLYN